VSLCTSASPPSMNVRRHSGCSDLKASKAAVPGRAGQLGTVSFPVGAIEPAVGFQPLQKLLLGDVGGSSGDWDQ